jgi:hypothetical protein
MVERSICPKQCVDSASPLETMMNLLLKYGGPKVSLVVGYIFICAAIGGLFSTEQRTVKYWLGLIVLVVLGVSCLANGRNSIRRR